MIQLDFSACHVVVIGGTSGINRGIAEAFASHGAKLTVASRSDEKVQATLQALKSLGAQATGFTADVRELEALQLGLEKAVQQQGSIDVLISGAAGNFPAELNAMSSNGFKAVMDIDLLGTFHVMRAAYPLLTKPGASIINISAPQAVVPMSGQAHVAAAKAGVDMITKTLCCEWGAEGLRINSIIPGPIEGTEGMARLAPNATQLEMCRQSVPLKRLGQSADIANACMFLASPMASYISGAVLPVDGGWLQGGVGAAATFLQSAKTKG